jgi:hypothetical protein
VRINRQLQLFGGTEPTIDERHNLYAEQYGYPEAYGKIQGKTAAWSTDDEDEFGITPVGQPIFNLSHRPGYSGSGSINGAIYYRNHLTRVPDFTIWAD